MTAGRAALRPEHAAAVAEAYGAGAPTGPMRSVARGELGRIWRLPATGGDLAAMELLHPPMEDAAATDVRFQLQARAAGMLLPRAQGAGRRQDPDRSGRPRGPGLRMDASPDRATSTWRSQTRAFCAERWLANEDVEDVERSAWRLETALGRRPADAGRYRTVGGGRQSLTDRPP